MLPVDVHVPLMTGPSAARAPSDGVAAAIEAIMTKVALTHHAARLPA
jgi:hypothetical protein